MEFLEKIGIQHKLWGNPWEMRGSPWDARGLHGKSIGNLWKFVEIRGGNLGEIGGSPWICVRGYAWKQQKGVVGFFCPHFACFGPFWSVLVRLVDFGPLWSVLGILVSFRCSGTVKRYARHVSTVSYFFFDM